MIRFTVLGRPLQATGLPAAVEAWLRSNWEFEEYRVAESPFTILLRAGVRAESAESTPAAPVRLPGVELPCRAVGASGWEIGGPAGGASLELRPTGSSIEMWGAKHEAGAAALYPALFVALCESLRASGLVPLHASVVARQGRATAFLARSGTGKSSTLLHAVRAGWQPIAEDFAWLEPESLQVYGWDRGVHLWPDARARFAPEGSAWTPGPDGKLFLPWEALEGTAPRVARLERIALLVRDATLPSAWEPLPPRDAVRALWEAAGVPLWGVSRAEVARRIPHLLKRIESCRLTLGHTPLPL